MMDEQRQSLADAVSVRFGWHGGKCTLAVEKGGSKLAVAWFGKHFRLRIQFLQAGPSERGYECDDI